MSATGDGPAPLTPDDVVDRLPSRPVSTNPAESWDGVVLQHYRHPPAVISSDGLRDNLLVAHLNGPVLVENDWGNGTSERRWVSPGQITLTPAGQPVHRSFLGRPEVVLVHLAPRLLQEVAQDFDGRDLDEASIARRFATPDATADHLVRLLLSEAEAPGPATSLMADTLARALTIHLLRFHHSPGSRPVHDPLNTFPPPRLHRAVDLMRSSLAEDLTLGQLAASAGVSPSHFARSFKQAMGQPPHRYLIGLRIERACHLLKTTDLPVIEIGLQCGFDGPAHFATAFRKITGHNPRAWRQLTKS